MTDFRYPKIKATSPVGQIAEIRSYLFQLVDDLNWALATIEAAQNTPQNDQTIKDMQSEIEALQTKVAKLESGGK